MRGGEEDVEDMAEIYKLYAKSVYRFLLHLSHDADLAEELTAETFYQAIKSINRYNGACKMDVWLCQIARHLWYRELEGRKKHRMVSLDEAEELPCEDFGADALIIGAESTIDLFRRMQELDAVTREVIYLRMIGDLGYREIGEILGRTETWARVTFYRGKERMKKGSEPDER